MSHWEARSEGVRERVKGSGRKESGTARERSGAVIRAEPGPFEWHPSPNHISHEATKATAHLEHPISCRGWVLMLLLTKQWPLANRDSTFTVCYKSQAATCGAATISAGAAFVCIAEKSLNSLCYTQTCLNFYVFLLFPLQNQRVRSCKTSAPPDDTLSMSDSTSIFLFLRDQNGCWKTTTRRRWQNDSYPWQLPVKQVGVLQSCHSVITVICNAEQFYVTFCG